MSEHKKSGQDGKTTIAVNQANPSGKLLKKARVRLAAILGVVVLAAGIFIVVFLVHRTNHTPKVSTKTPADSTLSPAQIEQQDIANDTDNMTKIADLIHLGYIYESQNEYSQAAATYKQAGALDTNDVRASKHLLELYATQKDKQDAITYAKKTISILTANPSSPYASDLQYYRDWLTNLQTNNFNPPKADDAQ